MTKESDITTSSEFGSSGTILISAPDNSLGDEAVLVFRGYTEERKQELREKKCLNPSDGQLVYVGRTGVPLGPHNFFDDDEPMPEEQRHQEHRRENSESVVWKKGDPIINANAIKVINGEKHLVTLTSLPLDLNVCHN